MNPVFIGGAWPYANGSLHIGHLAALLPGDVLARYFRQKGHPVLYVSGSDCHGTPIAVRARQEHCQPEEIASRYHQEFVQIFNDLGFSYDCYSRTDDPGHTSLVQDVFKVLLERGFLEERLVSQVYCPGCRQFLPDRYVFGTCPHCGARSRGDQCDACTSLLDAVDLIDKHCQQCGSLTTERISSHFYFRLSSFQDLLTELLDRSGSDYRQNARNETTRYLRSGLQDRAVTRDMDWGIRVPLAGYEDKRIYVWIDAVLGYLSASQRWSQLSGKDWRPYWTDSAQSWYVHGKDNIPFHSLILPALLQGYDPQLKKPDHLLSSEYLTLEGRKISTSRKWAVWIRDLLADYPVDAIRYYLLTNSPEKRDADFSRQAFLQCHNGELVGTFGNFVNRTFQFVKKFRDGVTPNEQCDETVQTAINQTYLDSGRLIESGEIKSALERIFVLIRQLNQYFDREKPWSTRHTDPDACDRTLATCLHGIVNLAQLLGPFLPFAAGQIQAELKLEQQGGWTYQPCPCGRLLGDVTHLFPRLDPKPVPGSVDDHVAEIGESHPVCDNRASRLVASLAQT